MQRQNIRLRAVGARPAASLQLPIYITQDATPEEIEEWSSEAALFTALLSHSECPENFRQAFTNIFTEHLLMESVIKDPAIIKYLYPLAVTQLQSWIPTDAQRTASILRTLRETLAPELTIEIQDALDGEGSAA